MRYLTHFAGIRIVSNFKLFDQSQKYFSKQLKAPSSTIYLIKNARGELKVLSAISKNKTREILKIQTSKNLRPKPFRYMVRYQLLPRILASQGLWLLHSSAIVHRKRATLFVGVSGSGKSTIAAHLFSRNVRFLSDEVVAIYSKGKNIYAESYAQQARSFEKPRNAQERFRSRIDKIKNKMCFTPKLQTTFFKNWPIGQIFLINLRPKGTDQLNATVRCLLKNTFKPYRKCPSLEFDILSQAAALIAENKISNLKYKKTAKALRQLGNTFTER